jgi:ABC-type uncharacterized transport system auxiliary subunit
MKIIYLFIISVLLAGCSGLLTSNNDVRYFYVLNSIEDREIVKHRVPIRLSVKAPMVPEWLDTDSIILLRTKNHVDYYAGARWVSNPSSMLGPIITESLASNRVATDIFYDGAEAYADYILVTEVIAFDADYSEGEENAPIIHVKMQMRLLSPLGEQHYQFMVESYTEAEENNLASIIDAFDESLEQCLVEIVRQTAQYKFL